MGLTLKYVLCVKADKKEVSILEYIEKKFTLVASFYFVSLLTFCCKIAYRSDLPDPRSGSGSGWIRPFFAWIRIRPDNNLKKDPDPVPAGS